MPYAVDDAAFFEDAERLQLSPWAISLIVQRIDDIKSLKDPRSSGGRYHKKWAYSVAKFQIVCEINDEKKVVKILSIVRLV
ncbi:MAG: hypothetical protein LBR94_05705 [Desulfovibrio sp.]|jgi:mRNA-degrading endonuclease RelE of RelBE toxin-antitoxin system|nr:hypothetical protein [Desulfovibrio sp.]